VSRSLHQARQIISVVTVQTAGRSRGLLISAGYWSLRTLVRSRVTIRSEGSDLRSPLSALGLRKGELLRLAWEMVSLDNAELYVGEQLQRVGRQLLRRPTKTEGSEAPLPSLTCA
jgi:hypothetical protein